MTTTIDQDATPSQLQKMIRYVPGDNIELILESLDDDLAALQGVHKNGDYVKTAIVFDIFLDVRNKLKNLLEDDDE